MRRSMVGVILCLLLLPSLLMAQGRTGAEFLKIGVGARQVGLGGAFTGVGDDVYTMYWNPGGLGLIRNWEFSAMYNSWFADMYHGCVSFAHQFRMLGSRKTTLGIGGVYLGMPSWDNTGGLEEPVSASDMMAVVSVGQRLDWLTKALSIGASVKYIQSNLDDHTATAYAGDIGMTLKLWNVTLGGAVQNIGTKMTFVNEAAHLPRTFRGGASLRLTKCRAHRLLLAFDVSQSRYCDPVYYSGAEYAWNDRICLRAGYTQGGDDYPGSGLTIGIGLGLGTVQADYVVSEYGDVLGYTHRVASGLRSVGPEPFRLLFPEHKDVFHGPRPITLLWEDAPDPDFCEEVKYLVMVHDDCDDLKSMIRAAKESPSTFVHSTRAERLAFCHVQDSLSQPLGIVPPGTYYWAVLAYDSHHHARVGMGSRQIRMFTVCPEGVSRWSISVADTTYVEEAGYESIHIPLVPMVFFDAGSHTVRRSLYEFYSERGGPVFSMLDTLIVRLKGHPSITTTSKGFVDTISGEQNRELADERARSVVQRLRSFGAPGAQLQISRPHDRENRRIDEVGAGLDFERIAEENRRVEFHVAEAHEKALFWPYRIPVNKEITPQVLFTIEMQSPAAMKDWRLEIRDGVTNTVMAVLTDSDMLSSGTRQSFQVAWDGEDTNGNLVALDRLYSYEFKLANGSCGGIEGKSGSFYVSKTATRKENRVFALAVFDETQPTYSFYWENLAAVADTLWKYYPHLRVRFEGHACQIGPADHNKTLSCERAADLTRAFRDTLRAKFPGGIATGLEEQVDEPKGFGEDVPLRLHIPRYGEVLLGDNDSPQGRNVNRRVEIIIYRKDL